MSCGVQVFECLGLRRRAGLLFRGLQLFAQLFQAVGLWVQFHHGVDGGLQFGDFGGCSLRRRGLFVEVHVALLSIDVETNLL